MNDVQKHQRRRFVEKLLSAYNTKEKPHVIATANAYVEGDVPIDALWKQIREDAQ
jgi:hypothetical protein